ncbi:MAG: arylesterase [Oligoflexales bacterium]|nr:arylesterase [Oligoflexales bacterium]
MILRFFYQFLLTFIFLLSQLLQAQVIPKSVVDKSSAKSKSNQNSATLKAKRIVVLGDSLSEGYGVAKEEAYPTLLEKRLQKEGHLIKIDNASVSGSTTASALDRLKWQMRNKPDMLILALGANDGLRGFKIATTFDNLEKAILTAKKADIQVVLVGMQMPINYGEPFRSEFEKIFVDLAKKQQVALVPFLLKGVGGEKHLNQNDGIHPNALGHVKMADTVYETVKKLL